MEVERGDGIKCGVGAHHDDIAVGEVQQQDDAVHHAVAQGHQRVYRAGLQAVDDLGKNQGQVHLRGHFLSRFFSRFWMMRRTSGGHLQTAAWECPSDVRCAAGFSPSGKRGEKECFPPRSYIPCHFEARDQYISLNTSSPPVSSMIAADLTGLLYSSKL